MSASQQKKKEEEEEEEGQEYIFLHDPYLRLCGTEEGRKEHPKTVMHCQYLVADGHGPHDTGTEGQASKSARPGLERPRFGETLPEFFTSEGPSSIGGVRMR